MSYVSSRDKKRCMEANARARKRNREFVLQDKKKRGGCERCDETYPPCLDYHHRNRRTKCADISDMVGRPYSLKRIKRELKKCILLCANCHRKEENPPRERKR